MGSVQPIQILEEVPFHGEIHTGKRNILTYVNMLVESG
jgi:hypothetical protein